MSGKAIAASIFFFNKLACLDKLQTTCFLNVLKSLFFSSRYFLRGVQEKFVMLITLLKYPIEPGIIRIHHNDFWSWNGHYFLSPFL
ncbi:hypothetical protein UYSO10_2604 [Kosakonia radicincitans]|nr:hypothetical protein UYSO10_2604 [Kosakonia radicincitans]